MSQHHDQVCIPHRLWICRAVEALTNQLDLADLTTLLQHGHRISDLTQRLARLQPRPARTVRPWDPKRYAAIYPEIVKAMVFHAVPHLTPASPG